MNVTSKKQTAFTLAEVLITLGVIGVVAAVTMPTLVKNYQKKETVSRLKRAYSEIQQVIKMSELEHGEINSWGVASTATAEEHRKYLDENFIKYFKPLKKCMPASKDCFNAFVEVFPEKYVSFISQNGMSYLLWIHNSGSGGWLYVDIDGPNKGKNASGKDIFGFIMQFDKNFEINNEQGNVVVEKVGVFPLGLGLKRMLSREELISGNSEYTSLNHRACSKEGSKELCGALIITDGWEIKDDYPW